MTNDFKSEERFPEIELVSASELLRALNVNAASTLHRRVAAGRLPPPVEVSQGSPAQWSRAELCAWFQLATNAERASWAKHKKRLIAEAVRDMLKPRKETA